MGGPPEAELQSWCGEAKSPWEDTWCCCVWLKSLEERRGGRGALKGEKKGLRVIEWPVDSMEVESYTKIRDNFFLSLMNVKGKTIQRAV